MIPLLLAQPPQVYIFTHDIPWYGIPLWASLGQLTWLCPPPHSLCPSSLLANKA